MIEKSYTGRVKTKDVKIKIPANSQVSSIVIQEHAIAVSLIYTYDLYLHPAVTGIQDNNTIRILQTNATSVDVEYSIRVLYV